ncbi:MAG TPA: tyrosine-type recombinase/integrase [Solirubrobacteraceae bacterium]|nr:tyrosine-type recombinase/integrase [Solirubrobacteraceae bacterium]
MAALSLKRFRGKVLLRYSTIRERKTHDGIRRILDHLDRLDVKSTRQLTDDLVMRFIQLRREDGVCTNTIIGELGRLKAIANHAVEWGYLKKTPFRRGERLLRPEPKRQRSHLEVRDLSRLLGRLESEIRDAVDDDASRPYLRFRPFTARSEWRARRLFALASTFAFTGARKLEVLYLQLVDVDLRKRILRIDPARRRLKTEGSARKVGIPAELAEVLEDWMPRTGCDWLFPGATGRGPWTGGMPGYKPLDAIKAACKRAGIADGGIHLFRHSFLTACEGWGVSREGAMRLTGITQEQTLEIYQHADEENLRGFVKGVTIRRVATS